MTQCEEIGVPDRSPFDNVVNNVYGYTRGVSGFILGNGDSVQKSLNAICDQTEIFLWTVGKVAGKMIIGAIFFHRQ